MGYKFNPFTGTLDIGSSVTAPPGTVTGAVVNFVVGDWVLLGSYYYLDLSHNLSTLNPLFTVYEGDSIVSVTDNDVINNSTIRLYVPQDPDSRFAGTAVFFKAA